jgi:REP element-mobilizing transposase RayT
MAKARKIWKQETLEYRKRAGKRGGRRKGAGRKRGTRVQHLARPKLNGRTPVHVTLRLLPEIGRLRRRDQYRAIRQALARAAHRDDCRICQYSIQGNHLHLIVEPGSTQGLSRGMIAFKTSCARRLNGVVGRTGRVFADRYHARYLTSPAQVRRALAYVLNNWRRHGEHRANPDWRTDPFSSADFFEGWAEDQTRTRRTARWLPPEETPPVADARFWLLTTGWRRYGAISTREVPGPRS